jgi:hypothetical protein
MANKRVSELIQITAAELTPQDLVLVSDLLPSPESKKLTLADLSTYLLSGGNLSGSFFGTASWAQTASYSLNTPIQVSASYALTAGDALTAISSAFASNAGNSDTSTSASYASIAGIALTASFGVANFASNSIYTDTASYLLYVPGTINGTASYALVSLSAITASYALTSAGGGSGITPGGSYDISASYASASLSSLTADTSVLSDTASYLNSPLFDGTASYALNSLLSGNNMDYGVFNAITQSTTLAQLDRMTISPLTATASITKIEAWGTIIIPVTSSVPTSGEVSLGVLNIISGITASLDSTPIYAFYSSGPSISGSIKIPFSFVGSMPLTGSYTVFVTSSANVSIEPTRITRFNITSYSDGVAVSSGTSPVLMTTNPSDIITFTSSLGGPATNIASNIATASLVSVMDISAVGDIFHIWTLPDLEELICQGTSLTDIGGMPTSIVTMSINNNALTYLHPLNHTALSILDCSSNNLTALPPLPSTMSYLDFSNNQINTFPSSFPSGLTKLFGENNTIPNITSIFPNSLLSMSFESNATLSTFLSTLPTSLTYLDMTGCSALDSLPVIPSNVIMLYVANCNMTPTAQNNITTQLVTNGQSNGVLTLDGNQPLSAGALSSSIASSIVTLESNGWTVTI